MCRKFLAVILVFLVARLNAQDSINVASSTNIDLAGNSSTTKQSRSVYKFKPAVDLPIMGVGTAWSLYAFTKIYNKDSSTVAKILGLDKKNIPGFDRWATKYFNKQSWHSGDQLFYGAMPLPLLLLFDNKIRKDYLKVILLYWESMSVTGFLYTGSVYINNRYRPYAYNPNVDMKTRTRGGAKNSFFAGHVALVATSTFYVASVLSDYHPHSKFKWAYYGLAGAATAGIAYMRLKGGQHFPSDLLVGITEGTLTGILVPRLHKNKYIDEHISFSPVIGEQNGLAITYRF